MGLGSPSKLSSFAEGATQQTLQIQPPPKLGDFVQQSGLMAGIKAYDEAFTQWAQTLQMNLNATIPKSTVPSSPA